MFNDYIDDQVEDLSEEQLSFFCRVIWLDDFGCIVYNITFDRQTGLVFSEVQTHL